MPIPPLQPEPLISGRLDTELTGGEITLGNVALEDPTTGLPIGTTGGALDVHLDGPAPLPVVLPHDPLPVTFTPAAVTHYRAAGTVAGIAAAGGNQALGAPAANTRPTLLVVGWIPNAALAGAPQFWVELRDGAATVVASVVLGDASSLVVPIPDSPVFAGTPTLYWGPNSGSIDLHYTVTGTTAP